MSMPKADVKCIILKSIHHSTMDELMDFGMTRNSTIKKMASWPDHLADNKLSSINLLCGLKVAKASQGFTFEKKK